MSKYSDRKFDSKDKNNSLSIIYNWIRKESKVLDVGCDEGYFAKALVDGKKVKVWGLEINHDAAEVSRNICEQVWENDLDFVEPFKDVNEKFDYIVFADVLEHTKNPSWILKKARELLNKDGEILISIPNIAHLSARLELMSGSFEYENTGIFDNTHLKYFTKKTFTDLIQEADFSIKEIKGVLRDIPKNIIESQLVKVGLSPSKKFWKMTETFESQAYQLVWRIRNVKDAHAKYVSPLEFKPMSLADDSVNYLKGKVKDLETQLLEYDKNLRIAIEQRESLKKQLGKK